MSHGTPNTYVVDTDGIFDALTLTRTPASYFAEFPYVIWKRALQYQTYPIFRNLMETFLRSDIPIRFKPSDLIFLATRDFIEIIMYDDDYVLEIMTLEFFCAQQLCAANAFFDF